jgi:hypothetical protein
MYCDAGRTSQAARRRLQTPLLGEDGEEQSVPGAAACSARASYSRGPSGSSREGQSPGRRADGVLASSSITIIVTVFTSILAPILITILITILVTILIATLVNIIINNVTFFFIVVVNILPLIVLTQAAAHSSHPSNARATPRCS